MTDRIKRLCILLGAVGAIAISAKLSPQDVQNPQSDIDVLAEVTLENDTDELARYNFMMQSKADAANKYKQSISCKSDSMELSEEQKVSEYECEVAKLQEKAIAIEVSRMEKQENSVNESLRELQSALNDLDNAIRMTSVSVNDVPVVASGQVLEEVSEEDSEESIEALIAGERIDPEYSGSVLEITGSNRDNLERLVMGEAGTEGFIGAALVAQTIHDTMIKDNNYDVISIKRSHAYSGSLETAPNENVKRAVAFIFDKGGMAVQHELRYFYAPKAVSSEFHEGRMFITAYGGHKFFDDWE